MAGTTAMTRKVDAPLDAAGAHGELAVRLLELRQRLEAWDRLYNEEMGKLSEQLTRVTSDYLHLLQQRQAPRAEAAQPRRPRKRAGGDAR
jgi:hypothetical protein